MLTIKKDNRMLEPNGPLRNEISRLTIENTRLKRIITFCEKILQESVEEEDKSNKIEEALKLIKEG